MIRPLTSPKKDTVKYYGNNLICSNYNKNTGKMIFYVNSKFGIVLMLFGTIITCYIFRIFL